MQSLIASLNDHPIAMLRGIAQVRGVALATNIREEVAAQLAAVLSEPEATETALRACSEGARRSWAVLAAAGGRLTVPAFTRRCGAIRPVGPGKLEREMSWQQPANPAEELWYRGLIFRAFADLGAGPAEYVYIPDDLLPPTVPAPTLAGALPPIPAGSQNPAQADHARNRLAVDLCTLLALLKETPLRLGRSGAPHPGSEDRLREQLADADPGRLALLLALARDLGWLVEVQGRLAPRGEALREWLRGRPWDQVTALFNAWRDSVTWNDLRRVPSLRAEGEWRNDPVAARRAVLQLLGRLRPDTWYAAAHFVAWIKTENPDFQRPDGVYSGWYLRDQATDRYLTGFESWDEVEGRLVSFLIHGPLFWLGALALAADRTHFRLTPEGAAWIAGAAPPSPAPAAHLAIDEKFLITAPLTLPLIDRHRLLRLAEPVAGPEVPDQATYLRITRRRLAEARGSGVTVDQILHFLQRASGGQVPPRVSAGLARWEQHGGIVRVSKGAVLRVEDAEILAALRADPVVAPLLGELLSAQAVMVSQANLGKLLPALANLGYTTKVDS